METFQFPSQLLERAKKITLADLLDTPFTQAWTVSMLSNALRACDEFPHLDTDSEHLEFQLHQVSRKIPGEQRMTLFKYCSNNVATHRQHNRVEV
tara:strand:- start:579 stop:863 length:285 start_codon:yes stop_codon:yes gene_type:complete